MAPARSRARPPRPRGGWPGPRGSVETPSLCLRPSSPPRFFFAPCGRSGESGPGRGLDERIGTERPAGFLRQVEPEKRLREGVSRSLGGSGGLGGGPLGLDLGGGDDELADGL